MLVICNNVSCIDCIIKSNTLSSKDFVEVILGEYKNTLWVGLAFHKCFYVEEGSERAYDVSCGVKLLGILSKSNILNNMFHEVIYKCRPGLAVVTNVPFMLPWGPMGVDSIDRESRVKALWFSSKLDLGDAVLSGLLKLLTAKVCGANVYTLSLIQTLIQTPFISVDGVVELLKESGCRVVAEGDGFLVGGERLP